MNVNARCRGNPRHSYCLAAITSGMDNVVHGASPQQSDSWSQRFLDTDAINR
jgi:hypothetical protein